MKVLVITGRLQHYRIPLFNKIGESGIDLTIAHAHKPLSDGTFLFDEVILSEHYIGPFSYHKNDLYKYCKNFDVVIATFYLQKLSFMRLLFGSRPFKLCYWGIGVKASQNSRFDSPTVLNKIRYLIASNSDAMLFYSQYAHDKYVDKGISAKKLFVANNTTFVNQNLVKFNNLKTSLLFIGTLNKSKKIFELAKAYKINENKFSDFPKLEIVGGGTDFEGLKSWIEVNDLSKKIILHGPIFDEAKKAEIFNRSICTISPDQAGLSVLESMGYGVPFITHSNAITGGERLNINDERGVLFDSFGDLEDILEDIYMNPNKYIKMGRNCFNYYKSCRTIDHMADSIIDAINYMKNEKLH